MTDFATLRQAAGLTVQQAAAISGCALSTAYRWENGEIEARPEALAALRSAARSDAEGSDAAFRFADLFAGIGGLRRGFDGIGGKCVFTSEWDRFAQATYRANYHDGPDHVFKGDITKVEMEDIPDHDVLLAGFPCQPFGFGLTGANDVARTLSARYHKDGSEILVDRGPGRNPRRLTPRECARLMGFDRPGQSDFIMPVSDTQAYRQFGNSVVVPVVEAIARHMHPAILRAVQADQMAHPVAAE